MRGFWDGGVRVGSANAGASDFREGASSACGWVLQVAWATASDGHPKWNDAIVGSMALDSFHVTSAFEAELWGIEFLTAVLEFFYLRTVTISSFVSQLFHSSIVEL